MKFIVPFLALFASIRGNTNVFKKWVWGYSPYDLTKAATEDELHTLLTDLWTQYNDTINPEYAQDWYWQAIQTAIKAFMKNGNPKMAVYLIDATGFCRNETIQLSLDTPPSTTALRISDVIRSNREQWRSICTKCLHKGDHNLQFFCNVIVPFAEDQPFYFGQSQMAANFLATDVGELKAGKLVAVDYLLEAGMSERQRNLVRSSMIRAAKMKRVDVVSMILAYRQFCDVLAMGHFLDMRQAPDQAHDWLRICEECQNKSPLLEQQCHQLYKQQDDSFIQDDNSSSTVNRSY